MDKKLLENAIKMCQYANKKMNGIIKRNIEFNVNSRPSYVIKFMYFPNDGGACICVCTNGGKYARIFETSVAEQGGWRGKEIIHPIFKTPSYVLCDDMVIECILNWSKIKTEIDNAIIKEKMIDEFEIDEASTKTEKFILTYARLTNDNMFCEVIGVYDSLKEARKARDNGMVDAFQTTKNFPNYIILNTDTFFEFDNGCLHFQYNITKVLI